MVRIRPSSVADDDVFLTDSLVIGTSNAPTLGLVLEDSGVALGAACYCVGELGIIRGKMGWVIEPDSQAPNSECLSVQTFKAARYTTVGQLIPLMRAIQNVALERALEWIHVVPRLDRSVELEAIQIALQRGEVAHPMCALLWEVGFVDLISAKRLSFVWRNPAF